MDKLIEEMKECVENTGDPEMAHSDADDILIKALLLISNNDEKVKKLIDLYNDVCKWYA